MSAGQEAVKLLKPFGCILVLLLSAAFLVMCFTSGSDPLEGYAPPESMEYYAENPEALASELRESVLPRLSGVVSCEVADERVVLTFTERSFVVSRQALLRYFDAELFTLIAEKN